MQQATTAGPTFGIAHFALVVQALDERVALLARRLGERDLSVLQTTVRKIEELLEFAAEYDDILRRQLARTNARIGMPSS